MGQAHCDDGGPVFRYDGDLPELLQAVAKIFAVGGGPNPMPYRPTIGANDREYDLHVLYAVQLRVIS